MNDQPEPVPRPLFEAAVRVLRDAPVRYGDAFRRLAPLKLPRENIFDTAERIVRRAAARGIGEPKCKDCNGGEWEYRRCRKCAVVYLYTGKYSDCGSLGCEYEKSGPAPCPACGKPVAGGVREEEAK